MIEPPTIDEHIPPDRTLLGPGPSDVHPRVSDALTDGMVGYLDDSYVDVMNDLQAGLRYLFQTDNEYTLAISGTGSAAMEAAFTNVVAPGETVLAPGNGYFGQRMGEVAARAGAEVEHVDGTWGEPLSLTTIEQSIVEHDPAVLGVVHGETSTGVRQPEIPAITELAHAHDTLVVVDTVATLGGVEFRTDEWDADVVYAGSQKCLSAPPGVSPITFSDAAAERAFERDTPVRSWYLDLSGIWEYWDADPAYHHTGPISTTYALREALRLVIEEGLEAGWDRHERVAGAMIAGIEAMGLSIEVPESSWLPTLNPVSVPSSVDDDRVVARMLDEHGIEIVGGLGALAGEIFRVGCMGHSARPQNATAFLPAFGQSLRREGAAVDIGAAGAACGSALAE